MQLTHVGVRFFRSIGETPVMIDLEKKITILVGQNDCGKSNVLRALEILSPACRNERKAQPINDIDRHNRSSGNHLIFRFLGDPDESDDPHLRNLGKATLDWKYGERMVQADWAEVQDVDWREFVPIMGPLINRSWQTRPPDQHIADSKAEVAGALLQRIASFFPRFSIVPQFRKIEDTGTYEIGGKGIVKLLGSWQHPEIGKEALQERFERINRLLCSLLERPNAALEIPASQTGIVVKDGSLRLPLESHGTGVHQLIILAIAVLSDENVFFGIEEPEIHLHPLLQRRFLDFLRYETKNRYVITTHSPTLISPDQDIDVVHLRRVDGVTQPTRLSSDAETLTALDDLGIRPSDLLQANAVIWVEGPSDRTYLNAWIKIVDPALREGVDYSIMFYGGRLLSHLTFDRNPDPEIERFLRMVRINQHSAVVMDSDRRSRNASINNTKQRIQRECCENRLHCWLTDGREIENYLPPELVSTVWGETAGIPLSVRFRSNDKIENSLQKAFGTTWQPRWNYSTAKVEWAHRLANKMTANHMRADLNQRIQDLIKFIRIRR